MSFFNEGVFPMPSHAVGFGEAFRVWVKIGLLSFGGPAGQIALMHRVLVEERRWLSENRFLHALNYCMLLPGPEAQQMATYVGWLLHGWRGGVVAGTLFVIPGFVSILVLSILYAEYQQVDFVVALFFGLKAATLAVVVEAVIRIGKKALKTRAMYVIAALAFVGIFFFEVPFPLIILTAGLVGLMGGRWRPESFVVIKGHGGDESDVVINDDVAAHTRPSLKRALQVILICGVLWFGPGVLVLSTLGSDHVFAHAGIFFSKAAVVTFGGAYAVLAYVGQQAVEVYGWLEPGEMLNGLGMAETTPGPLIQVVQYVGFMGGYRNPAPFEPLTAGFLASVLTTWTTFIPCFLWVFLGAPYIEQLRGRKTLSAGLSAITAAVVGVVLNLAVWFGVHVAFGHVDEWRGGGLRLLVPDLATVNIASLVIAAAAFVALMRLKWNMILTLGLAATAGIVWELLLRPALGA